MKCVEFTEREERECGYSNEKKRIRVVMARKNEVFETIKIQGLVYENPVSDRTNTLTTGRFPLINSVCQITDTVGTAKFSSNITCNSVNVTDLTLNGPGRFQSITTDNLFSSNILTRNLSVVNASVTGNNGSEGNLSASRIRIGTGILELSGSLLWTDGGTSTDLLGWVPKSLVPIEPLPTNASDVEIANKVNALLNVFKVNGIFTK
jgi:hypothetical protein